MKTKTICLNMIVKNESLVIRRCLESVKPLIDYWVIVDTGSTDGTQVIIKEYMRDIPGNLHQIPWKNFAWNRNAALARARGKADYFLFIDADNFLVYSKGFTLPNLEKDCYYAIMQIQYAGVVGLNKQALLIKDLPDFKWVGAVHETLSCQTDKTTEVLDGVYNQGIQDGHRSEDPQKYYKDIELLENQCKHDPQNSRDRFYLAKTYLAIGNYPMALQNFELRAAMNGQPEETFYSLYLIAQIEMLLKKSPVIFINRFCKAIQTDPSRVEPIYDLASYFIRTKNYVLGYLISNLGRSIPCNEAALFVEPWKYGQGVINQAIFCANHLKINPG